MIDHSGATPPGDGEVISRQSAETPRRQLQESTLHCDVPTYCLFDGLQWQSKRGLGRFTSQLRKHFALQGWRLLNYPKPLLQSSPARILLHELAEPLWREVLNPQISVYPHNVMPAVFLTHRSIRVLVLHDVLFLQGSSNKSAGNRYRSAKLKRSLADADIVITVSEASRSEIVQLLPGKKDVLLIPNALAENFADIAVTPRQRHDGPARILHFGGHAPTKNTLAVCKAVALLRRKGYAVELALAAMAGQGELVERWRLDSRLPEEALTLLPRLNDEELKQAYLDADVHCMPSTGEGFGIPVIEAASCGTPNVLSPLPVFRELIGDDAIFTDSFEAESIAQAIVRCLTMDDGGMTRRARQKAARFLFECVHASHAAPALLAIENMIVPRRRKRT